MKQIRNTIYNTQQVKTWFQNRRMKHKKQLRKSTETSDSKSGSESESKGGPVILNDANSRSPTKRIDGIIGTLQIISLANHATVFKI